MQDPVTATGLLVREGGAFVLKADSGRRWRLRLHRVPVDLVGKRVALAGEAEDDDTLAVTALRPA